MILSRNLSICLCSSLTCTPYHDKYSCFLLLHLVHLLICKTSSLRMGILVIKEKCFEMVKRNIRNMPFSLLLSFYYFVSFSFLTLTYTKSSSLLFLVFPFHFSCGLLHNVTPSTGEANVCNIVVDLLIMEPSQYQPAFQWCLLAQWNKVIHDSSFQDFPSCRSNHSQKQPVIL